MEDEVAQHELSLLKRKPVMFYSILFRRLYIVISFWRAACRSHDLFIKGAPVAQTSEVGMSFVATLQRRRNF